MDRVETVYHAGEVVTYRLTPWVIFLASMVSLLGSVTTVELLHRRETRRGLICQLHLALCAISFGLVAIWCMHFVGNKAIVMGDGRNDIQLSYSPGYTALSAILPIIGLYIGFSVVDRYGKSKRLYHTSLIVTGLLAGLSIMGMHYIGNMGTDNYVLHHSSKHILGATAIAVFDCWFSFSIFFHLREHWINYWWLRLPCAALLAAGVSDLNLILASVLSFFALVSCMALFWWTSLHEKEIAKRAHQVVLAALIRDEQGRILVTQEGLLPTRTITTEYHSNSTGNQLDKSHPEFQWMYRISHNWSGISTLMPSMKEYLLGEGHHPGLNTSRTSTDVPIFRAQFCVAAHDLANDLGIKMQDFGGLSPELMVTGSGNRTRPRSKDPKLEDVESISSEGSDAKGQTLFVSQTVDAHAAQGLVNIGFRFATLESAPGKSSRVLEIMANKMQVDKSELLATTRSATSASPPSLPAALTPVLNSNAHYISLFALRPRFGSPGCPWDVLVYQSDLSMIPVASQEPGEGLPSDLAMKLRNLEGKTPAEIVKQSHGLDATLTSWLNNSIHAFRQHIPASVMQNAVFFPTPITLPISTTTQSKTTIWPLAIILDVHNACHFSPADDLWAWIPFTFFQCLQAVRRGPADQSLLAQKSYIEFSTLLAKAAAAARPPSASAASSGPKTRGLWGKLSGAVSGRSNVRRSLPTTMTSNPRTPAFTHQNDNSSEKGLVHEAQENETPMTFAQSLSFGGILVSSEVVRSEGEIDGNIEMQDLGLKSTAGFAKEEETAWVDELYGVVARGWMKGRQGGA
ncbi:hypothetical protein M011DRAFT_88047 [Sporormia fimetaria CBS 119925]|uniref:MHYT domain-containing protein n=1 Tax=Sporormia fimetaria CBS 119925 TaxID=1340428 RepID=A0A6A6V797_9PLEO|nr:hypothetical protein M011DRAFT_88047 [Sporormia fimetaria CBS 119925]